MRRKVMRRKQSARNTRAHACFVQLLTLTYLAALARGDAVVVAGRLVAAHLARHERLGAGRRRAGAGRRRTIGAAVGAAVAATTAAIAG